MEPAAEVEPEPVMRKSLRVKAKRKLTEDDDMKNVQSANLPSGSFTLGNLLNSHIVSPSSAKPQNTLTTTRDLKEYNFYLLVYNY